MTFGKRLKKARTEKHMTQKQLAEMLSVKHNSISNWENDINKPDPDTIELICGILEITPNYLLATSTEDFSPAEKLIVKKYRTLDDHGKEMVDFVLGEEWERSKQLRETPMYNFKHDPLVMVAESAPNFSAKEDPDPSIQPHTIAAHFDGDELTTDELEEIAEFEKIVKNKNRKK